MARAHNITAAKASKARWEQHHADPQKWFWKRVDRTGGDDACWLWLGRRMKGRGGYGRLTFKGVMIGAHRMALMLHSGENRLGEFACHDCDNPPCCNPKHLFWGSPRANVDDCVAKGRKRGARPKIEIGEMLALREEGWTYRRLADRYDVNQASIGKAIARALRTRAKEANDGNE